MPLKIVIPICLSIMTSAYYLGNEVQKVRIMLKNAWTAHDMSRWNAQASILNPTMKYPDPHLIIESRKSVGL